jgi:hypothetical protein
MRELIGKFPIKHRGVVEQVYLCELVHCTECQKTVPVGIVVVTVKKEGKSEKVMKYAHYCRAHGLEYQMRSQGTN